MIARFAQFWFAPSRGETTTIAPEPPKRVLPPLFIGDIATLRGDTTEFHLQWRRAEALRAQDDQA